MLLTRSNQPTEESHSQAINQRHCMSWCLNPPPSQAAFKSDMSEEHCRCGMMDLHIFTNGTFLPSHEHHLNIEFGLSLSLLGSFDPLVQVTLWMIPPARHLRIRTSAFSNRGDGEANCCDVASQRLPPANHRTALVWRNSPHSTQPSRAAWAEDDTNCRTLLHSAPLSTVYGTWFLA